MPSAAFTRVSPSMTGLIFLPVGSSGAGPRSQATHRAADHSRDIVAWQRPEAHMATQRDSAATPPRAIRSMAKKRGRMPLGPGAPDCRTNASHAR
eukprot:273068-Lingulodinium_polyedra.AAC.1